MKKKIMFLVVLFVLSIFRTAAFAISDDSILSQHVKEADGQAGRTPTSAVALRQGISRMGL